MPIEKSTTKIEDFFENNVANPDKENLEINQIRDRVWQKINKIKEQLKEFKILDDYIEVEKTYNWLENIKIKLNSDSKLDKDTVLKIESDANRLINYFDKKSNFLN